MNICTIKYKILCRIIHTISVKKQTIFLNLPCLTLITCDYYFISVIPSYCMYKMHFLRINTPTYHNMSGVFFKDFINLLHACHGKYGVIKCFHLLCLLSFYIVHTNPHSAGIFNARRIAAKCQIWLCDKSYL